MNSVELAAVGLCKRQQCRVCIVVDEDLVNRDSPSRHENESGRRSTTPSAALTCSEPAWLAEMCMIWVHVT